MIRKKLLPIEQVTIDKFVHGGQGIGILADGRKCFVWGALPNEIAMVQLTKSKKDWAEGYAIEILAPSSKRVRALEPEIYLATSPWQILDYSEEANAKQAILAETFEREGLAHIHWAPFYQQKEPYWYRNKMEYNFWYDKATNQVSLALHRRGSHQKVAVIESVLASKAINAAGKSLITFINNNKIEARRLKSVLLRSTTTGEVGISLFVNDPSVVEFLLPYYNGRNNMEIVYSNPKSPASVATKVLKPAKSQLTDVLLSTKYSYSCRSFFQVNVPVYEKVLSIIKQTVALSEQQRIVDMYSGVGTIGLTVADDTKQVTLVEIDQESVKLAKQNSQNRKNITIVYATAESSVAYITGKELIIVDPPRAGLHKRVIDHLVATKPKTIIYLSCNPSTQARDIKELDSAGYKVSYAQGFNFFPRTPHIESLNILQS